MSASPTRVDCELMPDGSPSQEGNRVIESIARHEAVRALLAFSDLHDQIRNRRLAGRESASRDLFETERFILDEVLQLICDRLQVLTKVDGIVIALAEKSSGNGLQTGQSAMVCRASSGLLSVERGVRLIGESAFLQDCMESGRILRCDDCAIDVRTELDFARAIGARSTVLVPLRGRREQLGVMQAFSNTAWAFTDDDIRRFDLFSELVLSALKPEDQDRRINWLSEVADDILKAKPEAKPVVAAIVADKEAENENPAVQPPETAVSVAKAAAATVTIPEQEVVAFAPESTLATADDLSSLSQPLSIPVNAIELPEADTDEHFLEADEAFDFEEPPAPVVSGRVLSFPERFSVATKSRPGLSVVLGVVAVAALFSAGLWWGMQERGKTLPASVTTKSEPAPHPVTAPSVPPANVLPVAASDNLMSPASVASDTAPLTPVPADKLAALPKITGVRHWSSSVGSTVVIDMEDQVPYEVHRLMSPERIYFDLHDTVLAPELDGKTMDVGDAALSRVRVAQPVAGVTRIVLDTKDGSNFSVSMETSPYRLVVELRSGNGRLFAGNGVSPSHTTSIQQVSVSTQPAAAKAASTANLAAKASDQPLPAKTGKFRIVLDAGHGGWDLGTVGRQGLLEKDLVLDVTQRLAKLLQARLGSEVMLTRSADTYLPLDQRADFANQAQADLFVSVHANYSSSATARGVETYYTNSFSAPGSKEAEKHEDGTSAKLTTVSLTAGGLHEKIEESRRLASSVQRSLYATLAANNPDIRNRGIKDASYVVLTGTTMPAILTEISFVSSPEDEHNLQSASYRQQIAEALYKGIAGYQQSAPHAKIAQLQRPNTR